MKEAGTLYAASNAALMLAQLGEEEGAQLVSQDSLQRDPEGPSQPYASPGHSKR